ncbi:MAG: DUF998 domain-containing protein [Thermoplasmata archaeon]
MSDGSIDNDRTPPSGRLGPLVRRNVHRGGALLILGAVQFIVAMIVVQFEYPGYTDFGNYISDLGGSHSPWAWLFNISIRVLGILGILALILIRTAFPDRSSARVGLGFLGLTVIGAFLVGSYPEGSPYGLHGIFSDLTFISAALGLLIISFAMLRDTRWVGFRFYTFLSGLVTAVAIILFSYGLVGPLGVGGMERLIVAPILLWAILVGVHLLNLPTYAPGIRRSVST